MTSFGSEQGRDVSRYIGVELHETGDLKVEGRAEAASHLRGPHGGVRVGALLSMFDAVGGLCGGLAALPDGWVVTTNLAARTFAQQHTGPFRLEAGVLRRGRNSVVTAVQIVDEGANDALVSDGVLTSSILVPAGGPPQWPRPLHLSAGAPWARPAPSLPDWIGLQTVDATTVELPLADELRNPWGILHGGVVAALVDLAGEHATGAAPTDVVLHYLAPNRIGPVRATVRVLGARADGDLVRVEIRDVGANRLSAVAVAVCSEDALTRA